MSVRTRFAPSPTGRLHLGHALAAKVAHDLAKNSPDGVFLLRHEDLDQTRVREEFYQAIETDLHDLGILWSGQALRQSSRSDAYQAALSQLHAQNLIYPCFCSRREILAESARITAAPQGDDGPIYPGTCRRISAADRHEKLAAELPHAWRFDTATAAAITGPLSFNDLRFGCITVNPKLLGDIVISRKDIGPAYHLSVVVDDAFQQISHVTRGDDLLAATHVQRLLQQVLGLPEPIYLHHHLVLDDQGKRLAKRTDSQSIAALRAAGLSREQLLERIDSSLKSNANPH